jgi:hypothetical protein
MPEQPTGPRGRFFLPIQLKQQLFAPVLNRCFGFDQEQMPSAQTINPNKTRNKLINICFFTH